MNVDKRKRRSFSWLSHVSTLLLVLCCVALALSACSDDESKETPRTVIDPVEQPDNQLYESQLAALQQLVAATDGSRTVSKVTETEEGYLIAFGDGTSVAVKNTPAGERAPEVGVAAEEGVYYWTATAGTKRWLTNIAGEKVPVTGNLAQLPLLNRKDGHWLVSVDRGRSWAQLGAVAAAEGPVATPFLSSVVLKGEECAIVLPDGTSLSVPRTEGLQLKLSEERITLGAGTPVKVAYELLRAEGSTKLEVLEAVGVQATVADAAAPKGEITVLATDANALNEFSKVVLKATDAARSVTATIVIDEEGVLNIAETYQVAAGGDLLSISIETNLTYDIEVEKEAVAWIAHQPRTRALRKEVEVFNIAPNTQEKERSAIILFKSGQIERRVSVVQEKAAQPAEPSVPVGTVDPGKLYGYGAATTGGEGATAANILHFDSGTCFRDFLKSREGKNKDKSPVIIYLSGKFTKADGRDSGSPWFDIKDTENLSIYGVDGFVMENVGFFLKRASNIIIRNIHIKMPKADNGADGISMQESDRVWVDHCTFESMNQTHDYEDGSCDITHATKNVTVSWCRFIRTQKSCLVGHSNNASADEAITATFHHNYFDKSSSRHPRVRFGRVHVYNNYYDEVSTYGVGSAYGAKVLVEANSFNGVVLPTDICTFPAKPSGSSWVSNLQGSVAGYLYERDNEYLNKPAKAGEVYPFVNLEWTAYNGTKLEKPLTLEDFKPTYDYVVDPASQVPAIVSAHAGAGKLKEFAKAPVAVNNGGCSGSGGSTGTETPVEPETPATPDAPEEPAGTELANGWKWAAYNGSSVQASVAGGALTLTANGKLESGKQTFGYVYREVAGDFVATLQVDAYETPGTSNQSQAGLMLAPNFTAEGTDFLHVMAAQGPAGAFYRSARVAAGNAGRGTLPAATGTEKAILKLERKGNVCTLSYSLDGGTTYGKENKQTFAGGLPERVYVAIAVSSGSSTETATAVFKNFMLNGVAVAF